MPVPKTTRSRRSLLAGLLAGAALAPMAGLRPHVASAQGVTTPDGRVYTAYVPAATKVGQFYQYTCEFDAAWVILKTFGHDIPFEEQLAIVGHDTSVEPWYQETAAGFVIWLGAAISASLLVFVPAPAAMVAVTATWTTATAATTASDPTAISSGAS